MSKMYAATPTPTHDAAAGVDAGAGAGPDTEIGVPHFWQKAVPSAKFSPQFEQNGVEPCAGVLRVPQN
jgi:hypothetical protein